MTAAALVLVVLVAGIAGTSWQAVRAERARAAEAVQRETAEANERKAIDAAEAARAANERAQRRLAQIEEGNALLTSVFDDLNINTVKEGTEPLEAVLAKRLMKAVEQLDGESVGDPLVVAGLQIKLGSALEQPRLRPRGTPAVREGPRDPDGSARSRQRRHTGKHGPLGRVLP